MARDRGRSAASQVFLALLATMSVVALLTAGILLLESQRSARAEAERVTQAVAQTIAHAPEVVRALAEDRDIATARLQPFAAAVMSDARVDFVTVMDVDGIRITHRDPDEIGRRYLGSIPPRPEMLTEQFTGTLGPSLRTIVPVEADGTLRGWVSVGVTVDTVAASVLPRLAAATGIGAALVAAGIVGAVLARRVTRRVAGDLPAGAIRDTLASAESLRTLGDALRAQTHEHGNRLHAAVALLELGRTDEAIELLSASAQQSQSLVDRVAARTAGDATVGALLLGKTAQAAERGIELVVEIAPDAPASVLAPVDQVALVGNLLDNALDAAASAPAPRWVRVRLERTVDDDLLVEVADSGPGVAEALRERVFERGFSTKPAGVEGRGVGLALARSVVESAGGTLELLPGAPTTFRVVLPTEAT
ncbi:sensor histidine kinase [Microbacterium sp. TNHR37B]|uniref:sensor histidine kinase n=1 Tax=Microbacterium sp. TNHR37B TaxID=1775956 RepID=UPI0007B1BCFA|nr:ATP-binding protein [Microbacterium sp. TNHR37B]KZE90156.1 Sensor histidine kinase CitA [Microbacterium sp. TNHR37B]